MVWFTAALCAGIGIAAWGSFAFGSCYGAAAGTLIAAFLLLRNRYLWRAGLLCLVAACGCVAYSLGNTPASDSLRRMLAFHPDRLYTVSGTIDSVPVRRNDYGFCRLLLEAVHAHGQRFSCRGRISLKLSPRYLCSVGDRVRLKGLVKLSQPSCISVRAPGSLQVTGFNPRYLVRRAAARIKEGMRRIIMRRTREVTARLLSAMMLGDRHQVPLRVKRSLARCGTAHVLVISGFHVGVIAFVCLVLQKAARIPKRARILLTIAVLFFYRDLTGTAIPVFRASCMISLYLAGYLLRRECEIYHALALAAFVILSRFPEELFSLSFQLSFVSVSGIVWLYPRLHALVPPRVFRVPLMGWGVKSLLISVSAWISTCLLIAATFRMVSPIGLVANTFVVPLAGFLLICGMSLVACGAVFPAGCGSFGAAADATLSIMLYTNELLSRIPGAYFYFP